MYLKLTLGISQSVVFSYSIPFGGRNDHYIVAANDSGVNMAVTSLQQTIRGAIWAITSLQQLIRGSIWAITLLQQLIRGAIWAFASLRQPIKTPQT